MADRLSEEASKYAGKIKIGGGPVPLQRIQRPYLRIDRDRPLGAEGVDLHPERPAHQKPEPAPGTRTIVPDLKKEPLTAAPPKSAPKLKKKK